LETYLSKDISIDVPRKENIEKDVEEQIPVNIENSGQIKAEDISLELTGLDSNLYSFSKRNLGTISSGETVKSTLSVDVPASYGDAFPSATIEVSALVDGEEVSDSSEIQFQAETSGTSSLEKDNQTDYNNNTQSSQRPENSSNSSQGISWSAPDVGNMTGQFMENSSTLNAALAALTLFLMIVAVAVKKDKTSDGRGREGMRARSSPAAGSSAGAARSVNVSASESSQSDGFVCEETGESFDTKEGLEMYKEMNGLE